MVYRAISCPIELDDAHARSLFHTGVSWGSDGSVGVGRSVSELSLGRLDEASEVQIDIEISRYGRLACSGCFSVDVGEQCGCLEKVGAFQRRFVFVTMLSGNKTGHQMLFSSCLPLHSSMNFMRGLLGLKVTSDFVTGQQSFSIRR